MLIPKIIHQIWIQGYSKIPYNLRIYHQGCKNINHNFKFIFWDEIKILKLLEKYFGEKYVKIYKNYNIFAQKADFARYAILYVYGGIYMDMDMICRKNLMSFLNYDFFCTKDNLTFPVSKRYLNGIIGARPRHPVFLYVFEKILSRTKYSKNITYSTGTKLLYDSVKEYQKTTGNNDIYIIDGIYLHPCSIYNGKLCPYFCKDCYVASAELASWQSNRKRILNKYIISNLKLILFTSLLILIFILIMKL